MGWPDKKRHQNAVCKQDLFFEQASFTNAASGSQKLLGLSYSLLVLFAAFKLSESLFAYRKRIQRNAKWPVHLEGRPENVPHESYRML